jgi:hypothetical protein
MISSQGWNGSKSGIPLKKCAFVTGFAGGI